MGSTSATRWLSSGQQTMWRAFLGGTTVLLERLERDLRTEHGLSMGEYEILVRLSESPGQAVRMAALAEEVSHSRSRMTHTISRLETAGLVSRGHCSDDGRGVSAALTSHGFEVLTQAAHTHVSGVRSYLLDQISDEEFSVLGNVMERVLVNLDGTRF